MQKNCRRFFQIVISGVITSSALYSPLSLACTRVLYADAEQAVMVGRTMDWDLDMRTNLWVYPRGISHRSIETVNPMSWTSRYGSMVTVDYEHVVTDGMNEKGLAGHMLWLSNADYGERQPALPGLSVIFFVKFYLDNFATVAEAVRFTENEKFQITPFYPPETNRWVKVHLALEDASGDSAIIEYTNGRPTIYHDKQYTVVANSPTFDKQLENLRDYTGFGGEKPLPGTTRSTDRFVRASYYISHLPKPRSMRDQLAKLLHVIENVAEPEGLPAPGRGSVMPTIWRTVIDLTHRVYYFNANDGLNIIWASLDKFNLSANAPIMKLDLVHQRELVGDVADQFKPVMPPSRNHQ